MKFSKDFKFQILSNSWLVVCKSWFYLFLFWSEKVLNKVIPPKIQINTKYMYSTVCSMYYHFPLHEQLTSEQKAQIAKIKENV